MVIEQKHRNDQPATCRSLKPALTLTAGAKIAGMTISCTPAIVGDQAGSSFRFTDVQVNMFATLKRTVEHAQAGAGLHTTVATASQQQAKDNQTQARVPNSRACLSATVWEWRGNAEQWSRTHQLTGCQGGGLKTTAQHQQPEHGGGAHHKDQR